jgi:hypothetical protein
MRCRPSMSTKWFGQGGNRRLYDDAMNATEEPRGPARCGYYTICTEERCEN